MAGFAAPVCGTRYSGAVGGEYKRRAPPRPETYCHTALGILSEWAVVRGRGRASYGLDAVGSRSGRTCQADELSNCACTRMGVSSLRS